MASEGGVPVAEPRLHRFSTWFDPESAAVVTILLGLFQVLLSVSFAYTDQSLPKAFLLPFVFGILIVAGGSLTLANERTPSITLLRQCVCSNVVGLLGALVALCLYCYALNSPQKEDPCLSIPADHYDCPVSVLVAYSWSVTQLLLLFDCGAVVMHSLLSVSAFRTLKTF